MLHSTPRSLTGASRMQRKSCNLQMPNNSPAVGLRHPAYAAARENYPATTLRDRTSDPNDRSHRKALPFSRIYRLCSAHISHRCNIWLRAVNKNVLLQQFWENSSVKPSRINIFFLRQTTKISKVYLRGLL